MTEYNKKSSNAPEEDERKAVLKASLYLQALTFALLHYNKYKDRDYMWVNALTYRMNEPDIKDLCADILNNDSEEPDSASIDELFKLAHIMLNQPYLGMLKKISNGNNSFKQILNEE